ncbi:hypothetical protein EDB86DRAFT_1908066 [Lactarius hatsudake]|nr:hypothetical protein EDB86DRAFT_1908066 [Lactarius hatsudake]
MRHFFKQIVTTYPFPSYFRSPILHKCQIAISVLFIDFSLPFSYLIYLFILKISMASVQCQEVRPVSGDLSGKTHVCVCFTTVVQCLRDASDEHMQHSSRDASHAYSNYKQFFPSTSSLRGYSNDTPLSGVSRPYHAQTPEATMVARCSRKRPGHRYSKFFWNDSIT